MKQVMFTLALAVAIMVFADASQNKGGNSLTDIEPAAGGANPVLAYISAR